MIKKLRVFSAIGFITAAVSLLFVIGCSDNLSVNPNGIDPQQSPSAAASARWYLPSGGCSGVETITETTELITKDDGGEITITRDDYEHIFKVDPNAVDENVEISVKSYQDKVWGEKAIIFEFGPDGLVFEKAATLSFEMAELDSRASSAKLFYYNPTYKIWVLTSYRAVKDGIVEFDIEHFSKYAISD